MMVISKASSLYSLLILIVSFCQFCTNPGHGFVKNDDTIYKIFKSHGLPMGLLPKGVTNFSVEEDGGFCVHLAQACNAKFESELHFDLEVSGFLSYGKVTSLTGISAQELFLWFPVNSIHVDVPSSGLIYFDVGVAYKQFSLSLFEYPRDCMAVRSFLGPLGIQDSKDQRSLVEPISEAKSGNSYLNSKAKSSSFSSCSALSRKYALCTQSQIYCNN